MRGKYIFFLWQAPVMDSSSYRGSTYVRFWRSWAGRSHFCNFYLRRRKTLVSSPSHIFFFFTNFKVTDQKNFSVYMRSKREYSHTVQRDLKFQDDNQDFPGVSLHCNPHLDSTSQAPRPRDWYVEATLLGQTAR